MCIIIWVIAMKFQCIIWVVLCILGHNHHITQHIYIWIYAKIQTCKKKTWDNPKREISKKDFFLSWSAFLASCFRIMLMLLRGPDKASHELVFPTPLAHPQQVPFICLKNHAHILPLSPLFTPNRCSQLVYSSLFGALRLLFL